MSIAGITVASLAEAAKQTAVAIIRRIGDIIMKVGSAISAGWTAAVNFISTNFSKLFDYCKNALASVGLSPKSIDWEKILLMARENATTIAAIGGILGSILTAIVEIVTEENENALRHKELEMRKQEEADKLKREEERDRKRKEELDKNNANKKAPIEYDEDEEDEEDEEDDDYGRGFTYEIDKEELGEEEEEEEATDYGRGTIEDIKRRVQQDHNVEDEQEYERYYNARRNRHGSGSINPLRKKGTVPKQLKKWFNHLKRTKKIHKGVLLKDLLKIAKQSYNK